MDLNAIARAGPITAGYTHTHEPGARSRTNTQSQENGPAGGAREVPRRGFWIHRKNAPHEATSSRIRADAPEEDTMVNGFEDDG